MSFNQGWIDSAAIIESGQAPALADDIVGRVDISGTFVGKQLNIEYLYGLWFSSAHSVNSTSYIGIPVNITLQSLAIEPPIVFSSIVTDLYFPTIDFVLPIQIDLVLRFNDNLQVEFYDATFRRFPAAFKYLIPKLLPQIAKEFNQTYSPGVTNETELLTLRAATDICQTSTQYCVGNNLQYNSSNDCMAYLTQKIPFGDVWEGGQDTVFCRYIQRTVVKYRPDVHCVHIGPSGGDMCTAHDYLSIVNVPPFPGSLVAPNTSYSASDMSGLSSNSIYELMKTQMVITSSTRVAFYSVPIMVLFALLYIVAKATEYILILKSIEYPQLSYGNQRNTVAYIISTIVTTIALGFQLVAVPAFARIYTFRMRDTIIITGTLISALYIFEMTYRPSMRLSLLIHHFCTLFVIIAVDISLGVGHPATLTLSLIWLFQATTEQSVFIGLVLYRLRYPDRLVRRALQLAAIQSFIVKFVFIIYLIVWWATRLAKYHSEPLDLFMSVVVCVFGPLLLLTQIYGTWAVWCLALKISSRGVMIPSSAVVIIPSSKVVMNS